MEKAPAGLQRAQWIPGWQRLGEMGTAAEGVRPLSASHGIPQLHAQHVPELLLVSSLWYPLVSLLQTL